MKFIYITIPFFFLSFNLIIGQQIEPIVVNKYHLGLAHKNNNLYFLEPTYLKISKFNVTTSTLSDVITQTIVSGRSIAINGNYLYFTVYVDGYVPGITPNRSFIYKIDITSTTPTRILILETFDPVKLAFNNNNLYLLHFYSDAITKIDVTANTPSLSTVVDGIYRPESLVFKDGYMYVAETPNKIIKIDITSPTIQSTFMELDDSFTISSLALKDNDLYIGCYSGIYKTTITQSNPILEDVYTEMNGINNILFINDDLYFDDLDNIYKLDINSLSINNNKLSHKITLHPNPSSEFIQLSGLTKTKKYTIYNVLGVKIQSGSVSNNEKIEVKTLSKGLYLLKFDNANTIKFIKK